MFNKNNEALFINSKIIKDYYTNLIITIDEKNQEIKVYQDGEILETIKDFGELYDYTTQEYLYLGMGNPLSDSGFKYFKGLFDKLVIFEGILNEDEIKRLIENEFNVDHNKILWYDDAWTKNRITQNPGYEIDLTEYSVENRRKIETSDDFMYEIVKLGIATPKKVLI